jgi:hypothetical protein
LGKGTRPEPSREEVALPEEVFEDKEAMHVKMVCAQPRGRPCQRRPVATQQAVRA